jgi:HlyD family secretion protein
MRLSSGWRRGLQAGALAALVVLIVLALLPDPVPVDTETVERGSLAVVVRHEGRTRVRDRFLVSAPVRGHVRRIALEPGDTVRAGETVVAVLEPDALTPLDARAAEQARARARAAEASLERSRAERERAADELALARTERGRLERLFEGGVVSESELDRARTRATSAEEALRSAEASLRRARFELEEARAQLIRAGASEEGDESLTLLAPVDGVVLARHRESAGAVAQGTPLVEVADVGRMEIVADFLSSDAVRFRPGMPARIDGWGGDTLLSARVRRVEPQGFLKISALGVEEQRVNVVLDVEAPEDAWQALGDAYRVQVGVVVWESDNVLRVPSGALFRDAGSWSLFVVEGGEARLREVELGHRGETHVEVLAGLDEGERIIVHPSDSVEDGGQVEEREI